VLIIQKKTSCPEKDAKALSHFITEPLKLTSASFSMSIHLTSIKKIIPHFKMQTKAFVEIPIQSITMKSP